MFNIPFAKYRAAITLLAIFCVTGAYYHLEAGGLFSSFDRSLKNIRYELNSRPPSGDVVLVEIDSASLLELNSWPWPRKYHADVLDRLMEMGANEVAFDIDFSSTSNQENDVAFAEALERAGGYAYLAAFDQVSGITGQTLRSQPLPFLAQHARAVLVNVDLDREGMAVTFPAYSSGDLERIYSLALRLAKPETAPPQQILFDFRIDVSKIDRISFADVLRGEVAPERVAGKNVVIGASAIELRDFFETPRFGVIPGPLLQVLALETVMSGAYLQDLGSWPAVLGIFLATILGAIVLRYFGRVALWGFGITVLIVGEVGAVIGLGLFNLSANNSIALFVLPTALAIETLTAAVTWLHQRQALQKRLEYLALHDEVTGQLSSAGFMQKAQAILQQGAPLSILLIKIDRLNIVRGALGQKVADHTMQKIAERLSAVRQEPIGRVATDMFAIAFDSETEPSQLDELYSDLLLTLDEPYSIDGHSILIDASAAFAQTKGKTKKAADTLNNALIAMEANNAAHTESGHFKLYAPELGRQITERQQMDITMRQAIAKKEFRLAFQPQLDLRTGKLTGAEALIRWYAPDGVVSPGEFITLAEETGFIVQLGNWVIEEACRIASTWTDWNGIVSVNVSPAQMELSDVPAVVNRALRRHKFPAGRFCLEVTESVLVNDEGDTLATLRQFQKMGCTVAIDDFGTGYSSLSYLSELPFNKLKIDQSFVRGVAENPANMTIVQTIVDLSHKLGKSVIAEGIETETEHQLLRDTGCETGQGYYYAKPVNAATFRKLIAVLGKDKLAL